MGAVTEGARLGRYELTSTLRDPDLWLARTDDGGARQVVVRIATPEQVADPAFTRLSDSWASGELRHPNIVEIDDVGTEHGMHYIASEYIQGGALVQLLARVDDRGKQISLQHVLAIAIAIAEAMHHAHELGIHCAISPSQVLLGYDGTVKLDLGRAGMPPRPSYQSPEHAAGHVIDRRSDVFAIGIVIYESLTLDPLFTSGPGPVAKPSTLRKGLPSELEKIVMRALASNPAERHGTAGELRAALTQFASKGGMTFGGDALALYVRNMLGKPAGTPSTGIRASAHPLPTAPAGSAGKVELPDRAKAKPIVTATPAHGVDTVKGRLPSVDPTQETKLPEAAQPDRAGSPSPIRKVAPIAKLPPTPRPVRAESPEPAPLPAPPPAPPVVAAERAESERPDTDEHREPTMITSPPPPPIVIASTRPQSADPTPVVRPLPAPDTTPRARRPSTARAAPETEVMSAVARPSSRKLLIGGAVAVALAIPLVIALWPASVAKVADNVDNVDKAAQPAKQDRPLPTAPTPTEQVVEPAEPADLAAVDTPIDPPIEPAAEAAITPAEPRPEPAKAGEPKPSVFVPREGSGSAEVAKPRPAAKQPAKVAKVTKVAKPKPKPRVAAKSKPIKKPATKRPKRPTYDPDSLFLKKK